MGWRRAAAIALFGMALGCAGLFDERERPIRPPAPGGAGDDAGAAAAGGGGGSGGAGAGGTAGTGGRGGELLPIGEDPLGCEPGGPGRRPAAGTLLADPDAPFQMPPVQTEVEEYELRIDPAILDAMYRDIRSDEMRPATFTARGETREVLVRFRGNSSRSWPKKSWRVEFPEGTLFDGRRKLNLLSEWRDQTMLVEKLGYDLLAAMHVPAPRAKFVRLTINGIFQGVYLDLERVDKDFVRNHHFPDKDPDIYRCGRKNCEMRLTYEEDFQEPFEKKTNETQVNGRLDAFLCAVNAAPDPALPAVLDERLELEIYLRTMVMDALLSNDTVEDSRSYLILDNFTGRALYVPWDLNNSTTRLLPGSEDEEPPFDHPLFLFSALDGWAEIEYRNRERTSPSTKWHPLSSNLNNRIVFHPELRTRLLALLDRALRELFTPAVIHRWIDENHALIAPYMPSDPHMNIEQFRFGPTYLRRYVASRVPFLRQQIALRSAPPTDLLLVQVDPAAATVVIGNFGDAPVSTATAVLSTNLRNRPLVPNLPVRTLGPGDSMEVHLGMLGLAIDPLGEVALWATDDAESLRDLLYVGGLRPGEVYQRDETGRWTIR